MRVGWIILILMGIPGFISGQTAAPLTEIWSLPEINSILNKPFEIQDSLPDYVRAFANQGLWNPDGHNIIPAAALIKSSGEIKEDKNYTFVLESYDRKNPFEAITTLFSSQCDHKGKWRMQVAAVDFMEIDGQFEILQYSFYNDFGDAQTFLMWKRADAYTYKLYTSAPVRKFSHWEVMQKGKTINILHDPISNDSSVEIQLFNLCGHKLSAAQVMPGSRLTFIPTESWPAGIYIIGFSVNDHTDTKRVFIPEE